MNEDQPPPTKTAEPKPGEVWRSRSFKVVRYVRDVEDGYSVTYSRPADNHREWRTVPMGQWRIWVESADAIRHRKAPTVPDKDWRYATE